MRKPQRLSRRQTIKLMASGPVLPMLPQIAPSGRVASHHPSPSTSGKGTPWTPKFFSAHQNETVSTLAELIIPQTETPGAKAARVNEFIDLILSEETAKVQQEFLRGLEWMDLRSKELFKVPFIDLAVEQQTKLLETVASDENRSAAEQVGVAFFKDFRARTIFAYYTSEVGIHQELQYKGLDYLTEFPGCRHPEHLNWDLKD
jgi:glucoside 3-dehydrogenase (cytochrome c) hitch-hiker subunit